VSAESSHRAGAAPSRTGLLEKILVPLDGSEFGEQALPVARSLAGLAGPDTEIHLVHVHVSVPIFIEGIATVNPELERDREELEQEYVGTAARALSEEWSGTVRSALLHGPVDEALEEYADTQHIGLVLMSTHGRTGLKRAWLGSVTDRVIRRTGRPVLTFRPSEDPDAANEILREIGEILIPLDGSKRSETILPHAETLARLSGARITLLRVLPSYHSIGHPSQVQSAREEETVMARLVEDSEAYLADLETRVRERGFEVARSVEPGADPAAAILEVASSGSATLIAMATHGRGGMSRAFLGSVTDKVVRAAPCPLLLFRPDHSV